MQDFFITSEYERVHKLLRELQSYVHGVQRLSTRMIQTDLKFSDTSHLRRKEKLWSVII